MRHFASHGWIAAAPNHAGNLFGDHQSPLPTAHYVHRPLDMQEALDVVEGLGDVLSGEADTSGVLVSGHSFGASYTVWAAAGAGYEGVEESCQTGDGIEDDEAGCSEEELDAFLSGGLADSRVAAGLPMAGTARQAFFGEGYLDAAAPMLFQSGSEDGPEAAAAHYEASQGYDLSWLELEGGCHQTFALGTCDTLETELGYSIVQGYAMAFARHTILGDDTEEIRMLLQDGQAPWAEATLHPFRPSPE